MFRTFFAVIFLTTPLLAADPPVDRKVLKPGLVASHWYHILGKLAFSRPEPTVALLGQDRGDFTWQGYIQIVTPGDYTFSANADTVRFDVTLSKDDRSYEVLKSGPTPVSAVQTVGKPVKLETGFYRFEANVQCDGIIQKNMPMRRFELLWQGPGFQREPIPYFFFGHLPSQRPEKFADDSRLDHGRFLFEELACIKCHQPAKDDAAARTLVERTGPDLTKIGARAFPGWLDAWLADPA